MDGPADDPTEEEDGERLIEAYVSAAEDVSWRTRSCLMPCRTFLHTIHASDARVPFSVTSASVAEGCVSPRWTLFPFISLLVAYQLRPLVAEDSVVISIETHSPLLVISSATQALTVI